MIRLHATEEQFAGRVGQHLAKRAIYVGGMNQKPAWMNFVGRLSPTVIVFYAVQARDPLDDSIKSHKRRGHHYDRTLATTHQRACEEFDYRGSSRDWEYLLMKAKLPGMGNGDVIQKHHGRRSRTSSAEGCRAALC